MCEQIHPCVCVGVYVHVNTSVCVCVCVKDGDGKGTSICLEYYLLKKLHAQFQMRAPAGILASTGCLDLPRP